MATGSNEIATTSDRRHLDVVLDHVDLAEEVAEHGDADGPQHGADRRCTMMNVRWSILPTPATTGTNVRTIGTKRAMTIVLVPWRSKNSCALATFFC